MKTRLGNLWGLLRAADWIIPSRPRIVASFVWGKIRGKPYQMLPLLPDGLRLHVGAGQTLLDGYENLDGYPNELRPSHFQTTVTKFVRAEVLDTMYAPNTVAEIRCHHMFEHISMLDVDRTLRSWNKVMKPGGLLWIQVPDFEGCVKKILQLRDESDKEIFYRHIFGSQFGPGEFHRSGYTASRLIYLLREYGFETRVAFVEWVRRKPRKPDWYYPTDVPVPDLTVKAIKVSEPKESVINSEYTPVAYRHMYPNPELFLETLVSANLGY